MQHPTKQNIENCGDRFKRFPMGCKPRFRHFRVNVRFAEKPAFMAAIGESFIFDIKNLASDFPNSLKIREFSLCRKYVELPKSDVKKFLENGIPANLIPFTKRKTPPNLRNSLTQNVRLRLKQGNKNAPSGSFSPRSGQESPTLSAKSEVRLGEPYRADTQHPTTQNIGISRGFCNNIFNTFLYLIIPGSGVASLLAPQYHGFNRPATPLVGTAHQGGCFLLAGIRHSRSALYGVALSRILGIILATTPVTPLIRTAHPGGFSFSHARFGQAPQSNAS